MTPTRFSLAEWQSWREQGWSTRQIASHLGLSASRVNQIARQLGRHQDNDPQYRKTKPGSIWPFDVATENGAYGLGLLWGMGSIISPKELLIRHRDPTMVALLRDILDLKGHISESSSSSGPQFRMKISRAADVRSVIHWLTLQGWSPRQAAIREYP